MGRARGDSAAEAAAVRRIIRLRADIGTDVDEYRVGRDSAGCCKERDGALDLAPTASLPRRISQAPTTRSPGSTKKRA